MSTTKRVILAAVVVLGVAAAGAGYRYITTGGLIARQKPSAVETAAAQFLVNLSVPEKAKAVKNPLGTTDASLTAGRVIYQQKCENCHGYDGRGKTDAGSGLYPPPIDLSGADIRKKTDGELFYVLKNGHGHMPAEPIRQKPDELWNLINYVRSFAKQKGQ